jgi:hypothetical protein
MRKLSDQTWQRVRAALRPYSNSLAYYDKDDGRLVKRNIPVFANGKHLVAARTSHLARTALHIAPDMRQLQKRLGHELFLEGKLSSPNYVTISR